MSTSVRHPIILFCVAFLFCGLGHVVFYGIDLADGFVQFFCIALTVIWGLSVWRRVSDRRLCRLLLAAAFFSFLLFLLQAIRYSLVWTPAEETACWYAFYIPQMAIAVLAYEIAVFIRRAPDDPPLSVRLLPAVIGALLVLGILTNNLHQQAFRFEEGFFDDGHIASHGWLFYACYAWMAILLAAAWALPLFRVRSSTDKRLTRFLPLLSLALAGLYCVLYLVGARPRIRGIYVWQLGEVFVFSLAAFFESCIQLGMIPANTNYERFFAMAELAAVIKDEHGTVVYRGSKPFRDDADTQVNAHPIRGGRVEWAVDLSPLRQLERKLSEASRQLETRNAYLETENLIKREKTELEMRSRLYDNVKTAILPQLTAIDEALCLHRDLAPILPGLALTGAYVKRRANMELSVKDGTLPGAELATAMTESLEYLRLSGVSAAIRCSGDGTYPARLITAAYEEFEGILEENREGMSSLAVFLTCRPDGIRMRLMAAALTVPEGAITDLSDAGITREADLVTEDGGTTLTVCWRKGGEAS